VGGLVADPPPSSPKPLLWLALGAVAVLLVVYLLLGDAWGRWFPSG